DECVMSNCASRRSMRASRRRMASKTLSDNLRSESKIRSMILMRVFLSIDPLHNLALHHVHHIERLLCAVLFDELGDDIIDGPVALLRLAVLGLGDYQSIELCLCHACADGCACLSFRVGECSVAVELASDAVDGVQRPVGGDVLELLDPLPYINVP